MNRGIKRSNMNKNQNGFVYKAILCVAGIIALIFIAVSYRNYKMKEENTPYVQVKEVMPVLEALLEISDMYSDDLNRLIKQLENEQDQAERYLSFDELQMILYFFPIDADVILKEYKKGDWSIGLEDWNEIVILLIERYGSQQIVLQDLMLLGTGDIVKYESDMSLEKNRILTREGEYENKFWNIESYLFSNVRAICYKNSIISVLGYSDTMAVLENVYLADGTEDKVHMFWNGYHIYYPMELFIGLNPDTVADKMVRKIIDVRMEKGNIYIVKEKEDYVHGKLLQVMEDSIEIEGYGIYPIDENMQIYRLYKELASMDKQDLRIGYSFTDFIIDDGNIAACLMIKEEDMKYIRVLLKNSDLAGRYHEMLRGYCDQDCEVIFYENGVIKGKQIVSKGKQFEILKKDLKENTDRIKIQPSVLSAKITLESVNRNQGIPAYFGTLEITRQKDGLLVINEVLLEDYLCSVVPSEMPSSYPKEALMAQAVCARTYAYGKMLQAGLPDLGAHVDDSAGFQVYNNINEQPSTTEAVKETHNTIAIYNNEPIGAYYYSTSCGMGSDTSVWHGSGENPAYLTAREIVIPQESEEGISFVEDEVSPQSLTQEETFQKWITQVKDFHYESEEGWYRWTYERKGIDVSQMETVLRERYINNPALVLTQNEYGDFESREIGEIGTIENIEITKRITGGVADELIITGTNTTVKVLSELNIRYVLSDGITKVKRQTGDEVNASSILPSAFIIIETQTKQGAVTGYKITGGGFGHGVGMSQNGAKNMALKGMSSEEILGFFYPRVTLKTLHFEGKDE